MSSMPQAYFHHVRVSFWPCSKIHRLQQRAFLGRLVVQLSSLASRTIRDQVVTASHPSKVLRSSGIYAEEICAYGLAVSIGR